MLSFVGLVRPLQKETPVVVCIRTDTRNSTEYWPSLQQVDMIQPRGDDGEFFFLLNVAGRVSMSYWWFSDKS